MVSILALDFGGTKLAAALVASETGRVLRSSSNSTPQNAEESLDVIVQMAKKLLREYAGDRPKNIGVSFGGLVEMDGRRIRTSHHVPGWENYPLSAYLEEIFQIPSCIANDANAAALGEFHFGAGRGSRNLLYLTVSTGIGGGVITEGELYRGEHALAGEIGHMLLQPEGPLCPCGRRGCLEALASGRSIARMMRQRLADNTANLDGLELNSAKQVAEAARSGDPLALDIWRTAMYWLGIGIASAANLLNPGRVVIGGGLTHSNDLLFKPVREIAALYSLDPNLQIVKSALGDHAGMLGCTVLA